MGFKVLRPVGDRLPYDLALDCDGKLVRIQVKSAWYCSDGQCYLVDVRRTKTNRRVMLRSRYTENDFDFAVLFLDDLNVFYVMPQSIFDSFGSNISIVEDDKRQRKPRSYEFRNRWDLISKWAHQVGRLDGNLSNSVKPEPEMVIPSQVRRDVGRKGVETRWQAPDVAISNGVKV